MLQIRLSSIAVTVSRTQTKYVIVAATLRVILGCLVGSKHTVDSICHLTEKATDTTELA